MQHQPTDSFDWKRIIRRAELPRTTKLIAGFLGDFADADGSNVRPGVQLLAEMAGVTDRTVKTHLKALREAGLIEKTKHSRMLGQADVYCLTIPGGDHAPVLMRLNPEGERIDVIPTEATDIVQSPSDSVDKAVDNHSGEASVLCPYVKLDAVPGETGPRSRGSQIHPTNKTNHYQPFSGLPNLANLLVAGVMIDHGKSEQMGLEPTDGEYAVAREILMVLGDIEPVMTEAIAELVASGIADPSARQIAVRAADLATRPMIPERTVRASETQAACTRRGTAVQISQPT